jgi:glucokinase
MSNVVGIDLGGTKVAAALLSGLGADSEIGESVIHPTELSSADALLDQLLGIVSEAAGGGPLDAVGIGVPSVVEFATGRVISSVNIPLADVPLRAVLGERLGVPVFVDNDATVAALAEAHDESLQLVSNNLVMLTIGTGVGGGIVLNGRIFRGTGGAGEFGHTLIAMPVEGAEELPVAAAHFPQVAALESWASGHALDRLAVAVLGEGKHGVDVVAAARAGDDAAVTAVRHWAQAIGIGIANAINTFDPEEVVIGGGAAAAGALMLEPAVEFAQGYVITGLRGHATVRLARFGNRAGVIGACLLGLHELEGNPEADA